MQLASKLGLGVIKPHPPENCGFPIEKHIVVAGPDDTVVPVPLIDPMTSLKLSAVTLALHIPFAPLGEVPKVYAAVGRRVQEVDVLHEEVNRHIPADATDETTHRGEITCLTTLPPRQWDAPPDKLLTGSMDKTASVWDLCTGERLVNLVGHTGSVHALAAAYLSGVTTQRTICAITGSADATVRVWEATLGTCLRTFTGHVGPVKALAVNGPKAKIWSGGSDATIRRWNAKIDNAAQALETTLTDHSDTVSTVLLHGKTHLFTGSLDGTVKHWNSNTGDLNHTFGGSAMHEVTSIQVVSDYDNEDEVETILTGSHDGFLRQWDMKFKDCLWAFRGSDEWVPAIAVDTNRGLLYAASYDCNVRSWNVGKSQKQQLAESFPPWREGARQIREHYAKANRFARRMRNRKLGLGWQRYHEWYEDMMEQKALANKIIKFWQNRHLSAAWNKWRDVYGNARSNLGAVLQRWMNRQLSMAWNQWRLVYEEHLALLAMARAVKRWNNRELTAGLMKWRQWYQDLIEARRRKALGFWLNQKVSAAWNTYREWYEEAIRVKKSEAVDNLLMADPPQKKIKRKTAADATGAFEGLSPEEITAMSPAEKARHEAQHRATQQANELEAAKATHEEHKKKYLEDHGAKFEMKSSDMFDGAGEMPDAHQYTDNLGPARAKLAGINTKLNFEGMYRVWTNELARTVDDNTPPKVMLQDMLCGKAARDLGYGSLMDAWKQPGATKGPEKPLDLGAAFAMGRQHNWTWTGKVANLDVQEHLLTAATTEDEIEAHQMTCKQVKHILGYSLLQNVSAERMQAEFSALLAVLEKLDNNAQLPGLLPVSPKPRPSPSSPSRTVPAPVETRLDRPIGTIHNGTARVVSRYVI